MILRIRKNDRQVAANHDLDLRRRKLFDKPSEIGVHLGSTTGDVNDGEAMHTGNIDAALQ